MESKPPRPDTPPEPKKEKPPPPKKLDPIKEPAKPVVVVKPRASLLPNGFSLAQIYRM